MFVVLFWGNKLGFPFSLYLWNIKMAHSVNSIKINEPKTTIDGEQLSDTRYMVNA